MWLLTVCLVPSDTGKRYQVSQSCLTQSCKDCELAHIEMQRSGNISFINDFQGITPNWIKKVCSHYLTIISIQGDYLTLKFKGLVRYYLSMIFRGLPRVFSAASHPAQGSHAIFPVWSLPSSAQKPQFSFSLGNQLLVCSWTNNRLYSTVR